MRRTWVMVDFSYPRAVIERLAESTASFRVLDHHVTAQTALAGLPYAYFDMKKSGAVLAWEWAHPEPAPWLLLYIQDKDSVGMAVAQEPGDQRRVDLVSVRFSGLGWSDTRDVGSRRPGHSSTGKTF